jgi:hypothetical protein
MYIDCLYTHFYTHTIIRYNIQKTNSFEKSAVDDDDYY